MTQDTIDRYQAGNDIWMTLAEQYGFDVADEIADAAWTGDATAVNAALVKAKWGNPLPTSTTGQLFHQLTTDPLAAPAASLNNQIEKAVGNVFKQPWVLLLAVAAIAFLAWNTFRK